MIQRPSVVNVGTSTHKKTHSGFVAKKRKEVTDVSEVKLRDMINKIETYIDTKHHLHPKTVVHSPKTNLHKFVKSDVNKIYVKRQRSINKKLQIDYRMAKKLYDSINSLPRPHNEDATGYSAPYDGS